MSKNSLWITFTLCVISLSFNIFANDNWTIKKDSIDLETKRIKGISKSVTDWDNTPSQELLNFENWKEQREQRDKYPHWKTRLRDSRLREAVGKVLQCIGSCKVFRGVNFHFATHSSNIFEGDEVQTKKDSYTWIVLIDGALIRLSPNSSITFNEINVSKAKTFHNYRLNFGHLHWQHRQVGKFKPLNKFETDQVFLPLLVKEANREYFARKEFQKLSDFEKMNFEIRQNQGHIKQYEKLNSYLEEKTKIVSSKNSQVLISSANTTILATNSTFDLFYELGGSSYLRHLDKVAGIVAKPSESRKLEVFFRGYFNRKSQQITLDTWYEMEKQGRSLQENKNLSKSFKRFDLLIKRIPSIHLAREIILRRFYPFNFWKTEKITSQTMALDFSIRLWDVEDKNEMKNRLKYLSEFVRRIETTNLSSIKRFYSDKKFSEFDDSYTQFAFDKYLYSLKYRKTNHYREVREMTDTQYYAWILRYGQKSISTHSR